MLQENIMRPLHVLIVIFAGCIVTSVVVYGSMVLWSVHRAFESSRIGGLIPSDPVSLELQPEDYAVARKSFRTKLVKRGPAPQSDEPVRDIPSEFERITYRSGNLPLSAYVDRAVPGGPKRPGLLYLHGGFAFSVEDLAMAQPYRDAGYVVMAPVLRGENGQGGNFSLYYEEVNDVLAAAEALAARDDVDPSRLFIAGHSAGGTMTMLAAMTSKRFRAAAPISGSCSQLDRDPRMTPYDDRDIREIQMRSPLAYATSFKCPVRIYYGDEETWAVRPSQLTAQRARQSQTDVRVHVVPGDHFTCVPESIRRSIQFFNYVAHSMPAPKESEEPEEPEEPKRPKEPEEPDDEPDLSR
jgi:dienelactone hydrolase